MGYNREQAMKDIDGCLDQIIGYEKREKSYQVKQFLMLYMIFITVFRGIRISGRS